MKHDPLGPGRSAIKDLSIARRDFIKVCVAGTGSAAFTNSLARGTLPLGDRATPSRPNILYIHSHDTGRYIQSYGYNVPTPNLHRIAEPRGFADRHVSPQRRDAGLGASWVCPERLSPASPPHFAKRRL